MQYNAERRRRENMRRKRRRARQIRRRVCLAAAACIIAAVFAFTARTSRKAAENDAYIQIETGAAIVTASGAQNKDQLSQIADTSEITPQAVPREPVFVCLPVPMSEEEQKIVFDICANNRVAFSFVMAIIGKESEFDKEARSETGDSGYMQINDCNAEELERSHMHFSIYESEDDLIEIWEYKGETRGKCIVRAKETEDIDCYKRAIDELKNYKKEREEREHGKSAVMAG